MPPKARLILLGLCACLPAWFVSAQQPDARAALARPAIERLYAEMDRALSSGDLTAIAAILLPEAVTDEDRSEAAQVKAEVQKGRRFARRTTVTAIQLKKDQANVEAEVETETTATGSGETLTFRFTSNDLWVYTGGRWRIKESKQGEVRRALVPVNLEAAKDVVAEIKQQATPLDTVEAGHPFDDLQAFGKAVGDSRIVSLGEATHGTREIFQMKHRLLEYLVREKGFTVIAVEANWPESLAVDRYIKTGEGDPKDALAGLMYFSINTQETLDMVEWMRDFNKAPGSHPILTFSAFDMQMADAATEHVLQYLRRAAPGEVATAETSYREVNEIREHSQPYFYDGAKQAVAAAEKVLQRFDVGREVMIQASSAHDWLYAKQAAEVARQAAANRVLGPVYRDEAMAQNVEWLANQAHSGEKIVLGAHNSHVSGAPWATKSMGMWLRDAFGAQVYAVGFAIHAGEFRTHNSITYRIPAGASGSGDAVFSAAGMPLLFLDLRSVRPQSALGKWISMPQSFWSAGAGGPQGLPEDAMTDRTLSKAFDGLVLVEESHPSQVLPSR